jgi:hypothetical protein
LTWKQKKSGNVVKAVNNSSFNRIKIPLFPILEKNSRIKIMLKTEEWLLIRDLYSQGFSISEIANKQALTGKL